MIGAVTPTEAGTVAIVYALLLGVVYHEITTKNIISGLKESVCNNSLHYADRRWSICICMGTHKRENPSAAHNINYI